MHLVTRQTCRICGSRALKEVVNLGEQHLQGSFVKEGVTDPPQRKIPCVLVRCDTSADENACGLLQMKHSVPGEILYSDYWYRSGTNQTMRTHLAGESQMTAMAPDKLCSQAAKIQRSTKSNEIREFWISDVTMGHSLTVFPVVTRGSESASILLISRGSQRRNRMRAIS
jgi:hypothetical protein